MVSILKKLGPGLIFAGASIGVSHLVQSTRAGADFGLGLIWALLLIHLFKYPFFQFGARYAAATGESLLDGYRKLGKGVLVAYYIITFATMFTIQMAVTIVTAGLASSLFGNLISLDLEVWTIIIIAICLILLIIGKYKLLDNLMKVIILILTISTLTAVVLAIQGNQQMISFTQVLPEKSVEIVFLIAFMGWMPAPLDISVINSLWVVEKRKTLKKFNTKSAIMDFNVGYVTTIVLGIAFVLLGTLIMHNSGESFSGSAGAFSSQLINMYTQSLGNWSYIIIAVAAFTTMFSTALTTLDANPRAMSRTTELLFKENSYFGYTFWIALLSVGTICIFFFLASEMGLLIQIATILSFLTAPFYAIINYKLISSKHTPKKWHPSMRMHILSWLGIVFLIGFSIWYLTIL
ncbi:Nramp family divalent metal transporter [Yeosuana sp. MJ-SS3]|uniref:Nramp family divalent metal transporter n=1 Tax=Gilvirhabdus luticola TaxID=3079858 RepID=A0ABU3U4Q6_9FLAO|nr:Nramp family divalent metal transporter [Yeosuana sp. MJ-SS3]MDU8885299.1 Nramp family divalent metal transporter [Yeosuana sp. MJ-SS3]